MSDPILHFQHGKLDLPRDTSQYLVAGPVTFRRASKKFLSNKLETPYNNFGGNRQNIEKSMRSIYRADKGFKFVSRDQGGADALIVAYLCRHGKLRELFKNGIKPHIYNALIIVPDFWKTKIKPDYVNEALKTEIKDLKNLSFWKELSNIIKSSDDWASNIRFYYIGKKVGHAGNYGMMGNRFRMVILQESGGTIALSREQADKFISAYHTNYPEIHGWHNQIFQTAMKTKQLRNLFGFPLNITWFIDQSDMKDLYAWIPQSTVACITAEAMIGLDGYIIEKNKNWHILTETHDSILLEVPDNDVEEASMALKLFMEQELTAPDGTKFRMGSGVSVGSNWGAYKPGYNEEGMREI